MTAVAGAAFVLAIVLAFAASAVVATVIVTMRDGYRRVPDRTSARRH